VVRQLAVPGSECSQHTHDGAQRQQTLIKMCSAFSDLKRLNKKYDTLKSENTLPFCLRKHNWLAWHRNMFAVLLQKVKNCCKTFWVSFSEQILVLTLIPLYLVQVQEC